MSKTKSKTDGREVLSELLVARQLNKRLNEIFEAKYSNETLEGYYKFFESLKVILTATEYNHRKISYTISLLFESKGIENKIYEYEKKASKEIDSLIFTNNNNSKNFIQTILKECESIENRFKEIENENKLISDYFKNKDEFIKKELDKYTPSQRLVFDGYFKIRILFSDFYSKFIEKAGLNEIESDSKRVDLTERLLVIRFLQNENLFPSQNSRIGQSASQINSFLAILLSEKTDTIKKGFARVDKILSNKDISKENKSDRLRQLNNVLKYFADLNQSAIQIKIETLIKSINNSKK